MLVRHVHNVTEHENGDWSYLAHDISITRACNNTLSNHVHVPGPRNHSHLEFPVQILHAGPHLVVRKSSVPRDDLHDSEVRGFPSEALIDVQVEVCIVEMTVADGDVAPFVAHVDNPLIVATHHKPIGISRRNFIGRDPSVVVSHTYSLTMVAMEEVGNMTRLKNAAHYAPCIKIARDGTNREVRLHDLAEVISGGGEACEVPHRSCSSVSSLDLSGDAALRHATLPATHRALPNWISVLALEPSHHG